MRTLLSLLVYVAAVSAYKIPPPQVETLAKGFRASVPDEDGIQLVIFNANINTALDVSGYQFSKHIKSPKRGRWMFQDRNIKLRKGDVIYYDMTVVKDGEWYRHNGTFLVQETRTGPSSVEYSIPDPQIHIFTRGFEIAIPDEDGIELFAAHANINKPLEGLEAGEFSKDVVQRNGDQWIFRDRHRSLNKGDVIYYWLYVIKNKLGYRYDNGTFLVTDDIDITVPTQVIPTEHISEPKIEVLYRGFRVSIPHQKGIQLFAFHGNINIQMNGLEAGQFSKDIIKRTGDRWVFQDVNTKLLEGDVIYYWTFIIKDGLGYRYDNGRFVVRDIIYDPEYTSDITTKPTRMDEVKRKVTPDLNCQITSNFVEAMDNLTGKVERLQEITQILVELVGRDQSLSRSLKFEGVLPPYQDALYTAQVIVNQKLGVRVPVVSAERNADSSISFHVASLDDKIYLIRAANKELKGSKIKLVS